MALAGKTPPGPHRAFHRCAVKTQPRHLLPARSALCDLQPRGGAVKTQPLPPRLFLPPAAGARTSCCRWRRSDGFHCRSCCCHRLVPLLARRAERCAASSFVRSSGGSSRRAPLSCGPKHGPGVTVRQRCERAASGFLGVGERRELRWPRGQAWPGADPRVTSSARGSWRGWGTSAEGAAVLGRAMRTGFPCAISRFEPLGRFMIV